MGRDRGAQFGTSSGPAGKARSGRFTGETHLSLLRSQNAGQTGLNRITQAVSSTSTWYAFAGQVSRPFPLLRPGMLLRGRSKAQRTLLINAGKLGSRPKLERELKKGAAMI